MFRPHETRTNCRASGIEMALFMHLCCDSMTCKERTLVYLDGPPPVLLRSSDGISRDITGGMQWIGM